MKAELSLYPSFAREPNFLETSFREASFFKTTFLEASLFEASLFLEARLLDGASSFLAGHSDCAPKPAQGAAAE